MLGAAPHCRPSCCCPGAMEKVKAMVESVRPGPGRRDGGMGASFWAVPGTGPLTGAVGGTSAERGWRTAIPIFPEEMGEAWLV